MVRQCGHDDTLSKEEYRRRQIMEQTNAAFAALRADPDAWREELAEREVWDRALLDGLGDE
jgi:hypothetical protein